MTLYRMNKVRWFALPTLLLFLILSPVSVNVAQTPDQDEAIPATIFERLAVYAGPGNTYPQIATLGSGIEITINERNDIGNWLRIQRPASTEGMEDVDGWVLTGFISLPEDFVMTDLPVSELPDAVTDDIPDPDIVRLYDAPVIPTLSEAMLEVYADGLEMGNHPDVVVKVGDSNTANPRYLEPIAAGEYDLGPYDHLQDVVDYYGASFGDPDLATRVGLNAFSVFDALWSNQELCEPDEAPLHCEYRVSQPSIALIMFGQNDTRALNTEQWEAQMRRVVEDTLDAGVIPVLITFSSDDDGDVWFQAVRFNLILLDLAEEYEVPLVNFWSAARVLPNRGIGDDNAHLTGGGDVMQFTGRESRDGVPLLNLTVLYALDEMRRTLEPVA